jgi:hypothetical protein
LNTGIEGRSGVFITSIQASGVAGDNRTDWQNVQVRAQFSPSIDGPASEKCKHSTHKLSAHRRVGTPVLRRLGSSSNNHRRK